MGGTRQAVSRGDKLAVAHLKLSYQYPPLLPIYEKELHPWHSQFPKVMFCIPTGAIF